MCRIQIYIHSFLCLSKSAKQRQGTGSGIRDRRNGPAMNGTNWQFFLAFTTMVVFSLQLPEPRHERWLSVSSRTAMHGVQGGRGTQRSVGHCWGSPDHGETHWSLPGHLLFLLNIHLCLLWMTVSQLSFPIQVLIYRTWVVFTQSPLPRLSSGLRPGQSEWSSPRP